MGQSYKRFHKNYFDDDDYHHSKQAGKRKHSRHYDEDEDDLDLDDLGDTKYKADIEYFAKRS